MNFDNPFRNFRHFQTEKFNQQAGMSPGENNLRSLGRHANIGDIGTYPVALAVIFARDLFTMRQQCFGTTEVDNQVATLITTNNAVNQLANTVLEFVIYTLTLSLAHFLNDYLFGGLCCNSAKTTCIHLHTEGVTNLDIRINFTCFRKVNLLVGVLHLSDNGDKLKNLYFTGIVIEVGLEVTGVAIFFVSSRKNRSFQSFYQHRTIDSLVFDHLVNNMIQVDIHSTSPCMQPPFRW